ncbi:MAG: glycosyltransferase family 4 protein [Patescibacteria group bacterium]
MKIVQLAPFEEQVPPRKYGGTELIVSNLTEELVKRGHEVSLFASGDSKTTAKLIPICPEAIRLLPEAQDMKIRDMIKIAGVGRILEILNKTKADIIHNHLGWRLFPFISLLDAPVVNTLHYPLAADWVKFIHKKFGNLNFVSISDSQRKPLPDLNYVANVYNGIDIKNLEFNEKPKDYFAFLGRMSPEKGPVEAIKIAKLAGVNLKMAAKVDIADTDYFEKEVKPLIDGKQIEFVGEIGPEEKSDFLKNAVGLLSPIQWEEPFGLFFVEAMACGTPVIACKRGSVPEIVENGKNGFIINTIDEGVLAVKKIGRIDRANCRKSVEKKFTTEIMANEYEKVYKKFSSFIEYSKN